MRRLAAVAIVLILIASAAVLYTLWPSPAPKLGAARQDGAFTITPLTTTGVNELAIDPQDGTVYACQSASKTLWALDKNTRKARAMDLTFYEMPSRIAVDPVNHLLYRTATTHGKGGNGSAEGIFTIIDPVTATTLATIKIGKSAGALAVDSTGQYAYIATDTGLSVVDLRARRVAGTITAASGIGNIAIDSTTNTIYATDYSAETITVVNVRTRTISDRIAMGRKISEIAVDAATRTVYTNDYGAGAVAVLEGSQHAAAATVAVGSGPTGIVLDPATHELFVANLKDGTVTVIDTTTKTMTATIKVGRSPFRLVLDAAAHTVYVSTQDGIEAITRT
ncbi:YncE family protein [Nocardia yamanashiensis]|uniref:YncE family protein n=1 Tax=Nocardia yamanashiensis TaxID=209247 RepID=UPI000836F151|nr:YncE family protein [Nocardia yamanashiensis]